MSRFAYDKITKQSTLIAGSQAPVVIAGSENGTTASQAYTVGQYLVHDGLLYKVISAIAQGDTLVVDTNIQLTTVGNEITDIRDDLTASNATAGVTDVPFRFGCDDDGNFGYIINEGGADTVVPFKSGSSLVNLGKATTYDVSSYAGYGSFTVDNFIVEIKSGPRTQTGNWDSPTEYAWTEGFTVTKSYDATNGILTLSGVSQIIRQGAPANPWGPSKTQSFDYTVWLV